MKTFILLSAAAGLLISTMPQSSEAGSRKYHRHYRDHHQHFSQRDFDRLPIRITRPPNSGHYIHQDYPYWAARAFQPTRNRD